MTHALATYLKPGTPTGRWVPLVNDCNTYVKNTIQQSTPHSIARNGPKVVVYADGKVHQPGPNISK